MAEQGFCERLWKDVEHNSTTRLCDNSTLGRVKDNCKKSCNVCNGKGLDLFA